ncbi:MAG: FkbM family methyltransferase [Steroidobacteraceae bacterium]|jgi:FkbM family methyltransferase|nr:FkbM family methyltransferase [Steroidobacteraceae bacterium]
MNPYKRLSRQLRGRLRSRVLGQHGIALLADTRNGLLAVSPGDFNVSRQLLTAGEYDWEQVVMLSGLVGPGSRLVFAGAHIGALLVPITRRSQAREVVAYEPSRRNHALLAANLALNALPQVTVHNAALGERAGTVRFLESAINTGHSRVAAAGGTIEVPMCTLDGTLPADWPAVDLMVMDVEGSEVGALRGAAGTLAKTRFLYVEFAPENLAEQGVAVEDMIRELTLHFTRMSVFGRGVEVSGGERIAGYLQDYASRSQRLLNLLLSKD